MLFSEAGTLKYGVPQSSISTPLLFLLYVNDHSPIIIRRRLLFVCRWYLYLLPIYLYLLPQLQFLHRQRKCLTLAYRRVWCNALIQPDFDYGRSSWFPLLKKNLNVNVQKAQNKYIRFCPNFLPSLILIHIILEK